MTRCICALSALVLLVAAGNAEEKAAAPGYQVTDRFVLGGNGGWDYLTFDAETNRLFIARSDRVMVVDMEKGKLIGEVPKTPGVHGVALVPKANRGFISNGGEDSVTEFDLKTLEEVARIKVGKRPDAILYDPATNRVFTMNAGSKDASAIDVKTEKVVGKVDLGGKPEAAVSDEKGHIYVNLEDKSEIVDFDADKLKVLNRWPLKPGEEPAGLAIDRAKRRLFASCHNEKMVVLDADSGKVLGSSAIGKGTDGAGFDPDTGFAFSSNAEGTLTIVRDDGKGNYEVAETVKTQAGAKTMTLDPKSHRVFVATAKPKPGERRVYEPDSFTVLVVAPAKVKKDDK
jgi:YVTN family beta-propeller protein